MEYTIVEMPEAKIVGYTARTANNAPDVTEKIGGIWNRYMEQGMSDQIDDAIVDTYGCYGLYYNYDFTTMEYDTMVGSESASGIAPEGMEAVTIPAGKYAKFSTKGHVVNAVIAAWNDIWAMEDLIPLRANTVDFEAYKPSEDMDNTEIDLYIALK